MGAVGIEVIGAAFRRMLSRSRKWLENDESKNGRWPMPNVRNGWPPFGPKIIVIIKNNKKTREKNENEIKIAVSKTMYSYLAADRVKGSYLIYHLQNQFAAFDMHIRKYSINYYTHTLD